MATVTKKNHNQPDQTQKFEKFTVKTVSVDGVKIQHVTAQPGWQWSKHIKPVVGGDSCQNHHLIYMLSGAMHVKMNDGKEMDFGPGDVCDIPPGHDGWISGNVQAVWLDIQH